MANITVCVDHDTEIARLKNENKHMLQLLVDIEGIIDHCDIEDKKLDLQQIAVAIKGLRALLGTEQLLKGNLIPGLVRE